MILKVRRCLQLQLFGVSCGCGLQSRSLAQLAVSGGTVLPCAGVRCVANCVRVPARRTFLLGVLMG